MKCPRCAHENPPGMKFCGQCAAPLAASCPTCGAANPPGNRFCGQCAAPLSQDSPAKLAGPDSYTPVHLAEKILTSKSSLEGERKQVTVLFADLKGSMELLADRDPEEARTLLDPVLERMMEAVHRYEGTVNQVMGDGIMALFGAPLAHEDHAVRACYAALRMQEAVAQYAEGVFRSHGVPIQIRVGLNSGEVVVRAIGSDLHMDYTAVGQTTHLAARMEQMAAPGTILLAPATLQLAEGYVEVAARGSVTVKGLPDPVEVHALTGASAHRTRLHAAAARGLTRFVGRDAEVEQIRRALALAHDGRGQLVAIVGEPGVGKSRLVYEFTHSHRTQNWLILEAGSVSYGKATSYLPVIDLLKAYFKVHERETHREIREKVTGKLLTLDRTLEPILPAFLALLDVPVEDPRWQTLDPPQRREQTLDAVKHLLLRESQGQPLLVIFEDLHWIDGETQTLLDGLVESLPTARLLLLVNYRPEYQHGWGHKTYYSQLRLDALPPESASELLQALLGDDPGLEPLKRLLVRRGNPFFIEEGIRTLVETQALTGERGAFRLARPIQAIEVPPTVQVILAARIDRLPADDKLLLQTASVVGKDVPFSLHHAVAELTEDAVHRGLAHLQAAEFLYETQLPESRETLGEVLDIRIALGPCLGAVYGDGSREKEASYVAARELCRQLDDRPRLFPALWGLWHVGFNRGLYREARALAEGLLGLARELGDHGLLLEAHHSLWPTLYGSGDLETAELHGREGLAQYDTRRHRGNAAVYGGHDTGTCGLSFAALTAWTRGYPDRALSYTQEALRLAGQLSHPQSSVLALYYAAWVHYQRRESRPAVEKAEAARETASAHGLRVNRSTFLARLASEGALEESELARLHEAERPLWWLWIHTFAFCLLAEAHGGAGRPDRGLAVLAEIPEQALEMVWAPEVHRCRRALLLGQGDAHASEAETCFRSAVELARRGGHCSLELRAATSLSRLLAEHGRREEARRALGDVYGWFTEGFDTGDLKSARALLDSLTDPEHPR